MRIYERECVFTFFNNKSFSVVRAAEGKQLGEEFSGGVGAAHFSAELPSFTVIVVEKRLGYHRKDIDSLAEWRIFSAWR